MTPDETVILARYVRALCPQQKFDEYTPDAWHDVLRDLELDDCRAAAAEVARRQAFVAPAEIATEVRRVRDSRIGDTPPAYEPPTDDETGAQYIARRRAQLRAIADGRETPIPLGALTGGPAPAVAERLRHMLKRVGEMPAHIRQQITEDTGGVYGATKARFPELVVDCPRANCRAIRGRPCKTSRGREMHGSTHEQRQAAYLDQINTQTPKDAS